MVKEIYLFGTKMYKYFNLGRTQNSQNWTGFFLRLFALAPVFFSRPFYSRYLLHFIVFLTAVKLGVDYGQCLEMEP